MCFRPPTAGKPIKCPQCGSVNPSMAKNCIKCKTDLTKIKENNDSEGKG
jgi:ribosomal protein L40E